MAKSAASMQTFVTDVSKFVKKAIENGDALFRQTCQEAAVRIIMLTPVDTGFARGSWWADLDRRSNPVEGVNDKNGAITVAAATLVSATAKAGQVWGLNNNAAYIGELEYGHSKKAPSGMVRITAAAMPEIVEEIGRKLK